MRDRAVVLCPRLPWPLDDGGRIGLWQTIWASAQEFETTLLCMVPGGTEADPLPQPLLELGVQVHRVPHTPPSLTVAAWRGVLGRWPYTLARFRNRRFAAAISELALKWKPNFFLVNHLHLATYWDSMRNVPMILREHNLEYLWMERYATGLPRGPKRWYATYQAKRLRSAEVELCRKAAGVLAVTKKEARDIRALVPGGRVEALPVGIDCSLYGPPSPPDCPLVLLIGSFDWEPNADGAVRFLREGWPIVHEQLPGAKLRIAGRRPPLRLVDAARLPGVTVAGYVDDMRAELRNATALIVPLWVGAGARVKIVEAMASGLPVVSTTQGAEGLGLEPGVDFLSGDSPEALANSVLALLADTSGRDRMASEGIRFAESNWSLGVVAQQQNRICRDVVLGSRIPLGPC